MHNIDSGIDLYLKESYPWAVLLVTPIMKRTQAQPSSGEIIFIDSTSSCDSTQSTLTLMLTATCAGAIPIAILVHEGQTTESYKEAFKLLAQNYPYSFGSSTVSKHTVNELLCNLYNVRFIMNTTL